MNILATIPSLALPFVGPDGRLAPAWYQFFLSLFVRTGGSPGLSAEEVQADSAGGAPVPDLAPVYALIYMVEAMAAQAMATGPLQAKIAELEAQLMVGSPVAAQYFSEGDPIGSVNPNTGRFTTLNKVTIAEPANSAALVLDDAATLHVPNPGGTLGSAAYVDAGTFAAATHTALPVAATDAASTQALANAMRSALIAAGIGS